MQALSLAAIRLIVGMVIASSFAYAQQSGVVGQTEREIRILQERSKWAQAQTQKALTAMADKDYESAFAFSKSAVDALPAGGESSAGLRSLALESFSKAAFALATQRVSEGYYDDAELVVKTVADKPYSSSYPPLLDLRKSLRDPNHFNRTITPGFVGKVTQVEQLMNEAEGLYASGRFDAAFNKYQMVLNLDPENKSARLGMEKINKQRSHYAETATSERRSQMISDVARAWELPVPKINTGTTTIIEQSPIDMQGTSAAISRKLEKIRLPELILTGETVREAVEKLQKKSRTLDTTETDPAKKGVNIVLKLDPAKEAVDGGTKLNLQLNDLPLGEALKYIASAANLKVKIEPYAVALVPLSEPTETLISKEYKVPPSFISSSASSTPATGGLSAAGGPGSLGTVGKSGAKQILESQGVTFPAGASATYLASSSKLLVKNTQANLDLIDSLVEVQLATPPSQVEIEARFLEIKQSNLQELGFDWLMGAFQLPGGSGVNAGGGTVGNRQGQANAGNYPFVSPAGVPAGAMNVDSAGNVTAGNITAGNRTGSAAITANALDGLLFGSPAGPAAGILALAGVFTNPQFQVVLRAINQQKGIDLVSAPKVTVTSGRKATINIIQKFPYPRDYSPPAAVTASAGQSQPATPATPTSFETRNCGVQLEVEPTVGPDGYTIELSLSPQITEFEGFVNYGSPISTFATVYVPNPAAPNYPIPVGTQKVLLTPNTINQPVFSVRQVDTQVTVYDGQTVVLGGLMREDVQKVQDKTPIAGDLPLVGSLFRSSSNQRIKKNLIIFVSAGLLDPAGQPLIKTVENGEEISSPDAKAVASEAVPGDPSTASKSSR